MVSDSNQFQTEVVDLAENLWTAYVVGSGHGISASGPWRMGDAFKEKIKHYEELIRKPALRQALCPALRSAPTQIRETAQMVCTVLLQHSKLPQGLIPPTAEAFALVSVAIMSVGVSVLCGKVVVDQTSP
jgi:hypothetical protein